MICLLASQPLTTLPDQISRPVLTPAYSTLRVARSLASQRSRANEYNAQRVSGELRVTSAALWSRRRGFASQQAVRVLVFDIG